MPPADLEPPSPPPRGVKRWFAPGYIADPAVLDRGRIEVRLGVGLLLAGSVAIAGGAVAASAPVVPCIGIVVWQGIVSTGLLAGSPFARGLTMAAGGTGALVAAILVAALLRSGDDVVFGGADIILGVGMSLVALGSWLTTLAPAARVWQGLQDARRKDKRKAKSLTEWRSAPGGKDAGR